MRRGVVAGLVVLAVVVIALVAFGAYQAGLHTGPNEIAHMVQRGDGGEVVRVADWGHRWRGGFFFFPFWLLLFPLFVFGIFALARGVFGAPRGGWGPGGWGGPPRNHIESHLDDWHRRAHEGSDSGPGDAIDEP